MGIVFAAREISMVLGFGGFDVWCFPPGVCKMLLLLASASQVKGKG